MQLIEYRRAGLSFPALDQSAEEVACDCSCTNALSSDTLVSIVAMGALTLFLALLKIGKIENFQSYFLFYDFFLFFNRF
jgi:hypothetical protein